MYSNQLSSVTARAFSKSLARASGAVLSKRQKRDHNLDLIRATAIAMVLIYHGIVMSPIQSPWIRQMTNYGQYGVDLFFVLSGWLIGGLYWRERKEFGNVLI